MPAPPLSAAPARPPPCSPPVQPRNARVTVPDGSGRAYGEAGFCAESQPPLSTQGASKAVDWTLANLVKPEDELHLVHVIPVPMPEVVG